MAEEMNTAAPREASAPPLGGILERILDEVEAEGTPSVSPDEQPSRLAPSPDTPPPGGNLLGLLSQNPALLSALPTLMENLSPLLGGLGGTGRAPSAVRPHSVDRHTALLCALKPYLSPHRRDTAETVIRLCRVWDALEKSGVSLTGLLGSVGNTTPRGEGRGDRVQ